MNLCIDLWREIFTFCHPWAAITVCKQWHNILVPLMRTLEPLNALDPRRRQDLHLYHHVCNYHSNMGALSPKLKTLTAYVVEPRILNLREYAELTYVKVYVFHPAANVHVPSSIQRLSLLGNFNQRIDWAALPCLHTLVLGNSYNQPLTGLGAALKYLRVGLAFDHPFVCPDNLLMLDWFPRTRVPVFNNKLKILKWRGTPDVIIPAHVHLLYWYVPS